jgi:hypothetical protein
VRTIPVFPSCCNVALIRLLPAFTRSLIISHSNSAKMPNMTAEEVVRAINPDAAVVELAEEKRRRA